MNRDTFSECNIINLRIKQLEEQKSKLLNIKNEIIEILRGHTEIPEEELFTVFNNIKKLSKYLDVDIEKLYERVNKL